MTLAGLNALPAADARAAFEKCCGAQKWCEAMAAARPFATREAVDAAAARAFGALGREDWLEAFRHHPKIGDVAALREKFATTAAWAGAEQRGAAEAGEDVLRRLAAGNRDYEERFGYIFIVCATGKSADQMLALLEARLGNEPAGELAIAAGEQKKITALRLAKLLDESGA